MQYLHVIRAVDGLHVHHMPNEKKAIKRMNDYFPKYGLSLPNPEMPITEHDEIGGIHQFMCTGLTEARHYRELVELSDEREWNDNMTSARKRRLFNLECKHYEVRS